MMSPWVPTVTTIDQYLLWRRTGWPLIITLLAVTYLLIDRPVRRARLTTPDWPGSHEEHYGDRLVQTS